MKLRTKFLIIIQLFLCFFVKAQDKVYMPYFQIENMHWEYQISAAKIFRTYLNNNNKYTLILPQTKDSIYPNETFTQTIKNAKTAGAKYFIIGEMNALNDVMIISMSLYNTSDSTKVWSDILKARNPDDLDPILQKYANNIGTDLKASKDGDIYSVTNYDSKELSKVDASAYFGVSISGAYSIVNKVSNQTSAGFGLLASYDIRDIILDIEGDYAFGNVKIYDLRISGLYPFKKSKNTPFIGGSIAISGVTLSENNNNNTYSYYNVENGSGLSMFFNGGYIFNRNSNVNFRISGSVILPFYKTKINLQRPISFMLNAAILF